MSSSVIRFVFRKSSAALPLKFDANGAVVWERDWRVDGIQAPFTGFTAAQPIATDGLRI